MGIGTPVPALEAHPARHSRPGHAATVTEPTPTTRPRRSGRLALVGLVAALVAATYLAFRTKREGSILGDSDALLWDILGFWAAWAAALALLLRIPTAVLGRRRMLLLVVLAAATLRLASMTVVVPLSDDLYRYAWDGQVQAAGISPYRYAPNDPALRGLRTEWLWPTDQQCRDLRREPGCTRINRDDVRTIYPPLAQLEFLAGHLAGASAWRDLGWQVVALVADLATGVLLWRLLTRMGRDPRWVAAFAWSPVAVLEGVQNGHVDGLATFFVVGAVALAGRRPAASGVALAAATLVKLYPALLLPVLLGRRPVRVLTAFVATVLVGYLPHLLTVGRAAVGFLFDYLREEDYVVGTRYLLLRPIGITGTAATVVAGVCGLVVVAVVLRQARARGAAPPGELAPAACLLLGAALLLATPVQPWYGLPLVGLATLAARPQWAAVPVAAYPLFFAVVPAGPSPAAARLGSATFAAALAVLLLARVVRRRRSVAPASAAPLAAKG